MYEEYVCDITKHNDCMYYVTFNSQNGHDITQGTQMGLDMEHHHLGYPDSPIQVI